MAQLIELDFNSFDTDDQEQILGVAEDIGRVMTLEQLLERVIPERGLALHQGDYVAIINVDDDETVVGAFVIGVEPLSLELPEYEEPYANPIMPFSVPTDFPPNHWDARILDRFEGYKVDTRFDRPVNINDIYVVERDDISWLVLPVNINGDVYYYVTFRYGAVDRLNDGRLFMSMLEGPMLVGRTLDDQTLALPQDRTVSLGLMYEPVNYQQ